MSVLKVYKGDDTDFAGIGNLSIKIDTDLPLAGYTGKFSFLGVDKAFTAAEVATKTLTFNYTAAETSSFCPGTSYGILYLTDTSSRQAAVSQVEVQVLLHGIPKENQSITVVIENEIDYNKLANRPKINSVTVEGDKTGAQYGLGDVKRSDFSGLSEDESSLGDVIRALKGTS